MNTPCTLTARNDWTREEIAALFDLPFGDLMFEAQSIHRANFPRNEVQLSTLLSIKTGGCPEDCGYCSQSVKADSGVEATKLMDVQAVLQRAAQAKDAGSQRFCMGAAWRNPKDRDMPAIVEIVKGVRQMGMETCMTLGMLTPSQADMLAEIQVEATFPDNLMYYLKLNNSFLVDKIDDDTLYQLVVKSIPKARAYDLSGTRDILNFICLKLIYKDQFESDHNLQYLLIHLKDKKFTMDQVMNNVMAKTE